MAILFESNLEYYRNEFSESDNKQTESVIQMHKEYEQKLRKLLKETYDKK